MASGPDAVNLALKYDYDLVNELSERYSDPIQALLVSPPSDSFGLPQAREISVISPLAPDTIIDTIKKLVSGLPYEHSIRADRWIRDLIHLASAYDSPTATGSLSLKNTPHIEVFKIINEIKSYCAEKHLSLEILSELDKKIEQRQKSREGLEQEHAKKKAELEVLKTECNVLERQIDKFDGRLRKNAVRIALIEKEVTKFKEAHVYDDKKIGEFYCDLYALSNKGSYAINALAYLYQELRKDSDAAREQLLKLGLNSAQIDVMKREGQIFIQSGSREYSFYNQGLRGNVYALGTTTDKPFVKFKDELPDLSDLRRKLDSAKSRNQALSSHEESLVYQMSLWGTWQEPDVSVAVNAENYDLTLPFARSRRSDSSGYSVESTMK